MSVAGERQWRHSLILRLTLLSITGTGNAISSRTRTLEVMLALAQAESLRGRLGVVLYASDLCMGNMFQSPRGQAGPPFTVVDRLDVAF